MSKLVNKINSQRLHSPIHISNDLYILQYKDKQNKLRQQPTMLQTAKAQSNHCSAQQKGSKSKEIDHRHNIDRLMKMLKENSKAKQSDGSACSKIYKLIQKMYSRHWKVRLLHFKAIAFQKIKTRAKMAKEDHFTTKNASKTIQGLKDSLQFKQNQIERGSKHFELNELINIVTLHDEDKSKPKKKGNVSPKKISNNIYIVRKSQPKDEVSTQTKVSTNTNLKSEQFLPTSTQTARSISPNSMDRSPKKDITLKDSNIHPPQHLQVENNDNKLMELSIDSILMNKNQEADNALNMQEITNMKLPSFGKDHQPQQKRTNRLMDSSPKKIIFHYRNGQDKSPSPIRNQYLIPQNLNIVQTNVQKKQNKQVQQKMLAKQPIPTRFQRISSLQILNPKSSNNINNQSKKQQDTTKGGGDSVQTRRCISMPKITFTYTPKQQMFINPKPTDHNIMKSSPIIALNQLKSSNPNSLNQKQDSNLTNEIKINHVNQQPMVNYQPNTKVIPVQRFNNIHVENNYHIPVNNFANPNPTSPRPQRVRIISNYQPQTLPSTSFHSNPQKQVIKRNDYYGLDEGKAKIGTQETLSTPNKQRARSTDVYVMIRPQQNLKQFQKVVVNKIINADLQRERARSCNVKMQVYSKKPLIKAC